MPIKIAILWDNTQYCNIVGQYCNIVGQYCNVARNRTSGLTVILIKLLHRQIKNTVSR
jgi:hypothetical protein